MDNEEIMKKRGIVNRKIHELYYLIDIKKNFDHDKCFLFQVNEIVNYIWNNMEFVNDTEGMVDLLIDEINDEVDRVII